MKSRFKQMLREAVEKKHAISIEQQSKQLGVSVTKLYQWMTEFEAEQVEAPTASPLLEDLVTFDAATGEIVVAKTKIEGRDAQVLEFREDPEMLSVELRCAAGALTLQIADAALMPLEAKELALLASALTSLQSAFVDKVGSTNLKAQSNMLTRLQGELKA